MINFKANLVSTTTVKRINNKQDLKDVEVNFVKLNPLAAEDVFALEKTCSDWGDTAYYANRINTNFQNYKLDQNSNNVQFFAITEQSKNFDKLNPKKILGLAQTSNLSSGAIFLDELQVSPEHNYNASNALFKKIGTSVINSIKKLFFDKDIFVCPATLSSEIFYTKVGFRPFLETGIMRLKH